jgi:hypothetical protein
MILDDKLQMFLWGFGGSCAIEIYTLYQAYNSESALPQRYKRFGFWVVRFFLAIVAGGLVIAHDVKDKPLLALNIGISAPLLLQALARGVPSPDQPNPPSTPGS